MRIHLIHPLLVATLLWLTPGPAYAGPTLDAMRRNGEVRCGVSPGVAHMSLPDSTGRWQGFDAEICRAMAAAVFGDANRVRFVPTTAQTRCNPARWTC